MLTDAPVVARMDSLVQQWERESDHRAVFLRCYMMMTSNVLAAIQRQEFDDPDWVDRLLHRFADYYFVALEAYGYDPASAPAVWQLAYNATQDAAVTALQNLLLGVNAHINYDLVLALVDLLESEWADLSDSRRSSRYADHCRVNDVIGRTIDAVQDQVLEPAMPVMALIDRLLGPADEILISRLISHWREAVWTKATHLLEAKEAGERAKLTSRVEEEALTTGEFIAGPNQFSVISHQFSVNRSLPAGSS